MATVKHKRLTPKQRILQQQKEDEELAREVFGNIVDACKKYGYLNEDVWKAMGKTDDTYRSRVEEPGKFRLDELIRIARLFNMSLDQLVADHRKSN